MRGGAKGEVSLSTIKWAWEKENDIWMGTKQYLEKSTFREQKALEYLLVYKKGYLSV